ncbi:SixA phosphatase family protein [Candidatus Electrothrix sp.]|uniref:SixA phosphatase family protein n=1 Tax=Candidatus Electrothrix sp. TaxID=2170559 RepID=UPI004057840D
MKKIHLIRHAKSSWKEDALADIARPLNKRGIKACRFMAQHILDAGCSFDNVFCSPAVRAQLTIELINSCLEGLDITWHTEERLYTFDSDPVFAWCRTVDESVSELVIVGHNPALTDFCNVLTNGNLKNIPTCGYAQLTLKKKCRWRKLAEGSAELTEFLRPKKLMKNK